MSLLHKQSRRLHSAIVAISEQLGATSDHEPEQNPGFFQLCPARPEVFAKLARKLTPQSILQRNEIILRIHVAFSTVHFYECLEHAAWMKKSGRQPSNRTGATIVGMKAEDFRVQAPRIKRLKPDDARVLRLWLGKEPRQIWATNILGQALAYAYEDITGNRAQPFNNESRGVGSPGASFCSFCACVIAALQELPEVRAVRNHALHDLEPQNFARAVRDFSRTGPNNWLLAMKMGVSPRLIPKPTWTLRPHTPALCAQASSLRCEGGRTPSQSLQQPEARNRGQRVA